MVSSPPPASNPFAIAPDLAAPPAAESPSPAEAPPSTAHPAGQVSQWIAEIQALRQQVADLKGDRDRAYAAAERWQERYTIEANQRRAEAERAKARVLDLEVRLARAEGVPLPSSEVSSPAGDEVSLLPEATATDPRLIELTRALEAERAAHAQTRQSLTLALGDAIDAARIARTTAQPHSLSESTPPVLP